MLAINQAEKKYLLGECKYKKSPFSYGDYLDVAAKLTPEKEKNEFYYYLFSRSGFAPQVKELSEKNDRILLRTLEDIVNLKA